MANNTSRSRRVLLWVVAVIIAALAGVWLFNNRRQATESTLLGYIQAHGGGTRPLPCYPWRLSA
ncbi:MAG: hypothetical protein J6X99_03060 [Bacteroidales bacterium]|nr:hypothetical protein [Bacteroidales bacterium]